MAKFFVLSTDQLTAQQITQLKNKLGKVIGWWHWLPNFWLIKDPKDEMQVGQLTQYISEINPMARCIAMEVDPVNWAARARNDSNGKSMTAWIEGEWRQP
ncbi:hypothetical protein [Asticcacaulis excentricus]|uniref:Uncharacterized protein n=1 Tax=Asticcacaulis excentricus (strain ATCC 15261 / DSM 4724 / KCTC 12464 / NCIMB 9791 / VKM B-1370 / CB 48) TaxID=573065 RepID=E8RPM0_ASTEC|nr:hypothetical protein [Asticcacaulis excentricus]ADU11997.1 hypothetical protein Astex_0299 [Asticcacaulis excentricus CB 48]